MNELSFDEIKNNLFAVNEKICDACKKAGRNRNEVTLMAVSKFHSVKSVENAINAGQLLFGENRVQEAYSKFSEISEKYTDAKVHMIGQLQTNKVRDAVKIAQCIQSVDRISLLDQIQKQCERFSKKIDVLFEYHTAEDSKSGFSDIDQIKAALDGFTEGKYPNITVKGFMTMAPFTKDESLIRKSFCALRNLSQKMQDEYKSLDLRELSMGMSGDFEIAVEEGSTLVRVGTAIFGERVY